MGFVGDLRDFSLKEVLQILVLGRKTGKLTIGEEKNGDGAGLIALLQGRVVHAEMPGGGEGVRALVAMLDVNEGRFRFETVEPDGFDAPTTIERTLESLLLEATQAGLE